MTTLTVAPDAALALGIASTAMPFARTPEDQAERWLRVLRLHGRAGVLLHALGVREARVAGLDEARVAQLEDEAPGSMAEPTGGNPAGADLAGGDVAGGDPAGADLAGGNLAGGNLAGGDLAGGDPVELVSDRAAGIAHEHGATSVTTLDLLRAAMDVYGADFDRVLRAHGTDCAELDERLSDELAAAGR